MEQSCQQFEFNNTVELVEKLQANKSITALCFERINLSRDEVKQVVSLLDTNNSLTSLHLDLTPLDEATVDLLSQALSTNRSLISLQINLPLQIECCNPSVTLVGYSKIGRLVTSATGGFVLHLSLRS